jgi:hypothetical protein
MIVRFFSFSKAWYLKEEYQLEAGANVGRDLLIPTISKW